MVEAKGTAGDAQQANQSAADQTLAFFDSIFDAVPPVHRQVEKDDGAKAGNGKKQATKGKQEKKVSLLELNERAQDRIEAIRRANALKSQTRIKELTAEHIAAGKGGPKKEKKSEKQVEEVDVIMDSDEEESKTQRAKPKKNGGRREPLEGEASKKVPSKGSVSKSKLENKRTQKEALKKKKLKRGKGTVKEPEVEGGEKTKRSNSKK